MPLDGFLYSLGFWAPDTLTMVIYRLGLVIGGVEDQTATDSRLLDRSHIQISEIIRVDERKPTSRLTRILDINPRRRQACSKRQAPLISHFLLLSILPCSYCTLLYFYPFVLNSKSRTQCQCYFQYVVIHVHGLTVSLHFLSFQLSLKIYIRRSPSRTQQQKKGLC